jgi:thioredoxin-like negative regulator of GroEL
MMKHKQGSGAGMFGQSHWQLGAVVGVLALIVIVLVLKETIPSATSSVESDASMTPTLSTESEVEPIRNVSLAPAAEEAPEAHLQRMLAEGYPILAFFHSTTCYQCTEMTRIVGEVYPDFENEVALVAVNVYDERNQSLLQQAGIRVIPTLIFVDRSGSAQGFTGIIPAEQVRAVLTSISSGDTP